jgi:PKD repeat protein
VTPSHTYTAAGTYTVRLTVTDNRGQTGSTTRDVSVTAPPVTTYASDQFTRTVTTGFGTAPIGGTWTNTGAVGNLSVSAGTSNIKLAAGYKQSVYLASATAPQVDMLLRFGLDKPPTGGGVHVAGYARRVAGQGGYAGKAKLSSTGAVSVEIVRQNSAGTETVIQTATPSGLTYAVGDVLNLRVQVLNTTPAATIRARIWQVGTAEPSTWLRSVTDSTAGLQASGSIGVQAYNSTTSTNAPITAKLDELIVTNP